MLYENKIYNENKNLYKNIKNCILRKINQTKTKKNRKKNLAREMLRLALNILNKFVFMSVVSSGIFHFYNKIYFIK